MHIDTLSVGPIQTNAYLVTCSSSRDALLIDPGWPAVSIRDAISAQQAIVKYVVNTHAHWDHIAGNAVFINETHAQFALHEKELPLLKQNGGADAWHVSVQPSPSPDRFLEVGDILEVGALQFEVLYTPGHTPGHISLYEATRGVLFDGDVLFRRGIGRTDLPGGSSSDLICSIRDVLFSLPDDVLVYPGHGPHTTIGEERAHNPWIH